LGKLVDKGFMGISPEEKEKYDPGFTSNGFDVALLSEKH
jgi:hypothetical protein